MTLESAAQTNDKKALYIALRDDLCRHMDKTDSARDYAQMARTLLKVCDALDANGGLNKSQQRKNKSAISKAKDKHRRMTNA